MIKERRYKMLLISKEFVFNFFAIQQNCEVLQIPILKGIPEDVVLVTVNYNIHCDAFAFMLYHFTFDVVPDFATIPVIEIEEKIAFKNSRYKKINQPQRTQRKEE